MPHAVTRCIGQLSRLPDEHKVLKNRTKYDSLTVFLTLLSLFALFYLTGSNANQRNRRDTGSVSLEDVRSEIQTQLRSLTASQLCSPPDKVCVDGPPGAKGEPGERGKRGKKG